MTFRFPRSSTALALLLIAILAGTAAGVGALQFQHDALPVPSEHAQSHSRPSAGLPVTLVIPSLNIRASIESVGLTSDNAMDVPTDWRNAAWFSPGTRPGEWGNAVLAGHLDSDTGPAVFWRLKELKPGDLVHVIDDSQTTHTFRIRESTSVTNDTVSMATIFGTAKTANLNLITCAGTWNKNRGQYEERLVVFAEGVPVGE